MTQDLFRQDAYLQDCTARVVAVNEHGVVLDRTVFYPLGGGQAGDTGTLLLGDGTVITIADTRKAKDAEGRPTADIVHVPAEGQANAVDRLQPGVEVTARIDWARRHRLMRFHTTTHLLCHLVPVPVNGCSITADAARLDLVITDALDKEALTEGIAALVAAGLPVTIGTISDAELDAQPELVKSMSVSPPRGSGSVRTVRIGQDTQIDLQPCGGTHVVNTSEIGRVVVTRIEKKSATTRRVVLAFSD